MGIFDSHFAQIVTNVTLLRLLTHDDFKGSSCGWLLGPSTNIT